MNVPPARSTQFHAAASAPAQIRQQGDTSASGSRASPSSPPEGLSPRTKEARIKEAYAAFGRKIDKIQQAVKNNADDVCGLGITDVAAKQLIAEERKNLHRSLSDIEQPVQRPASNEPQRRIVGFGTPP